MSTRSPRLRLRPVSLGVAAGLALLTLLAFWVTWQAVLDQERQLLDERADEVESLVTGTLDGYHETLAVLARLGAVSQDRLPGLFERAAVDLVEDGVVVEVVAAGPDGFEVLAGLGPGRPVGTVLTGARAGVVQRAAQADGMVADLVVEDGRRQLVLAHSVDGGRTVAYRESVLPSGPMPADEGSPFRTLRVALYAAPGPDPSELVVTTEAELPLEGDVLHRTVRVGVDEWTLVAGPRDALQGAMTRSLPWLLLGLGLLVAALVGWVVETLARRRGYAQDLVEGRTEELQQALEELHEVQSFQDRLLTAGPVLVGRSRVRDQQVDYVSPNVERLYGITETQCFEPGFLAGRLHPEDAALFGEAMGRVASGASELEVLEYRFLDGQDEYRWVGATMVPDPDPDADGQVSAVLNYVVDVDDRRRTEEALREARSVADTANRAKSEFLSRMSHELRTPLNSVLGFAQILQIEPLTDSQRDAVDHIVRGGQHLLDLINEVLDISRIETGDLALSPEPVLLPELVEEVAALMRPLAEQRGLHLVVDQDGGCEGYAYADRQRAKQVLLNLVSNAVKYNRPNGSVALSCERAEVGAFRVSVIDTGMGIPRERQDLLFQPFERLGAEHGAEEGTGIGLALSKRLTEAMGGQLDMTSALGRGSTFTLTLPQVEGPVERFERLGGLAPTNGAPAPGGNGDRGHVVLHIEDNLANLRLIERVLAQRPGTEVVAAMQGRLGLELAREHLPTLVLLDLHLPDMDGDQVLRRLREDRVTASIPVVILSADATPGQIGRLLSAGAAGYVTKPIDVRTVLRHFDEAVASR